MTERLKAPWPDFAGGDIYEGDYIRHPSGEIGRVYWESRRNCDDLAWWERVWLVDYGDSFPSRLALQIGDRGMAVVVKDSHS